MKTTNIFSAEQYKETVIKRQAEENILEKERIIAWFYKNVQPRLKKAANNREYVCNNVDVSAISPTWREEIIKILQSAGYAAVVTKTEYLLIDARGSFN